MKFYRGSKTPIGHFSPFVLTRRSEHAQTAFAHLEVNRTASYKFTVELYRYILLARNANARSLKIFDLRQSNFGTEENLLQVVDDVEIPELLEDDHIQQPIIDDGLLEEWKRAAIASAVSDEDKRSLLHRGVGRFDEKARRFACCDLRC